MSTRITLPPEWGMLFAAPVPIREKRLQHDAAHRLLQESLPIYAAEQGIAIAEMPPQLSFGEQGKPSLTEYPEIRFNLSHCDGLAVCLFSAYECGADCESIRRCKSRVAKRVCTPQELAALDAAENPDLLFTRLWTLKEAYVKAIGIGISYPLHEVGFAFAGDRIIPTKQDASFLQLLLPDHIVSLCVLEDMGAQRVIKVND